MKVNVTFGEQINSWRCDLFLRQGIVIMSFSYQIADSGV